jgi:hypothetical protein
MIRRNIFFLFFIITATVVFVVQLSKPRPAEPAKPQRTTTASRLPDPRKKLLNIGRAAKKFCSGKGYSTSVCFLVDMSLPSGKKRFFIFDLQNEKTLTSGLVAHGSCNTSYQLSAKFSNQQNCGCSSKGKYKVTYKYNGRFGTAYKLIGMDSTNSNAFARFVVLHGYDCVPDEETFPAPICNSLGCPMVSNKFLGELSQVISKQQKPVLLWMFE